MTTRRPFGWKLRQRANQWTAEHTAVLTGRHKTVTTSMLRSPENRHTAAKYRRTFIQTKRICTYGNFEKREEGSFNDTPKFAPRTWLSLTVACARSRSRHRSQTSDSRNIHCTSWPEIRRCRWSALSPPWQSRLPESVASEAGAVTPERKTRSFQSPGDVSPIQVHVGGVGEVCFFSLCRPTQKKLRAEWQVAAGLCIWANWKMQMKYFWCQKTGRQREETGKNSVGDEEIGLQQWTQRW